ncbi:MAG: alkaline phosphatase family protein [Candidatus Hydrogenedentes bacterium]|nr:alkaline phosphatase family protein [Candidatus Hydrogenedentota bacterium]
MKRFLLIGLDGAEPGLIEPWMAEERLPNLARLRERGSYLRVRSTVPPATFPAWTSCVTGVNPGRHGVFDFTEMAPRAYAIRFVNATHRKAPALWRILSDAGKRVGVLGVPATYPPEPVNGFMVSGFDSPVATEVDRSFVYPADLYSAVRGWRFADFQETRIEQGWHAVALSRLLAKIEDKKRIAVDLYNREPWDFFMVVFGESDTVAHHFWLFQDSASPRWRRAPGLEDAIGQVYERLDAAVGALVKAAGPDVVVGVVSDHGFGGAGTGVVHLNNWLANEGLLAFAGPATGSLLKRLALRATPHRWQGGLFRRFHNLATRAESQSRFGGIDWGRTLAWSEELNYFPSIRVNLQGREPAGQVAPGEYEAFCRDLCARLEQWAPVRKAWRREELYEGDYVKRAPDIVLELALEHGYSHSCLRSRGGPPFRRLAPGEYFGGKERGMTGNHRSRGVLFLSEQTEFCAARIEDVAPTVLAELGVPAPAMDGTSLLTSGETAPDAGAGGAPEEGYTPEQEREIEGRLRDLGYFE